ncbi:hypothetical protein M8J76_006773 [Diaphorina citri]|nr:hypothetical protein M8J76_006773 [Diaphorina citri]
MKVSWVGIKVEPSEPKSLKKITCTAHSITDSPILNHYNKTTGTRPLVIMTPSFDCSMFSVISVRWIMTIP